MASAETDMPSRVVPVHTAVPGRARLRVEGLYRNGVPQRRLEALLPDGVEIQSASANPRTGTVLVSFAADLPLAKIVERIGDIVRASPVDRKSAIASPAWHAAEISETLLVLDAYSGGLTSAAARDRLRLYGPNALPFNRGAFAAGDPCGTVPKLASPDAGRGCGFVDCDRWCSRRGGHPWRRDP